MRTHPRLFLMAEPADRARLRPRDRESRDDWCEKKTIKKIDLRKAAQPTRIQRRLRIDLLVEGH